jgi:hypothetical protein
MPCAIRVPEAEPVLFSLMLWDPTWPLLKWSLAGPLTEQGG